MTLAKISLTLAAAAVLALSGCEMTNPDNPNHNTESGAAIGAGLGALVGIAAGDTAAEPRAAARWSAPLSAAALVPSVARRSTARRRNCASRWAPMSASSTTASS